MLAAAQPLPANVVVCDAKIFWIDSFATDTDFVSYSLSLTVIVLVVSVAARSFLASSFFTLAFLSAAAAFLASLSSSLVFFSYNHYICYVFLRDFHNSGSNIGTSDTKRFEGSTSSHMMILVM